MAEGTVEWFHKTEGHGRVRTDDGKCIFVHRADLVGDARTLAHGDRVAFEVSRTDEGIKAVQVRKLPADAGSDNA